VCTGQRPALRSSLLGREGATGGGTIVGKGWRRSTDTGSRKSHSSGSWLAFTVLTGRGVGSLRGKETAGASSTATTLPARQASSRASTSSPPGFVGEVKCHPSGRRRFSAPSRSPLLKR